MLKGVIFLLKPLKIKQKNKKGGFLSKLLGSLGTTLLGNFLSGKTIVRAVSGRPSSNSSTLYGKGTVRAGYGKECHF